MYILKRFTTEELKDVILYTFLYRTQIIEGDYFYVSWFSLSGIVRQTDQENSGYKGGFYGIVHQIQPQTQLAYLQLL